MRKSVLIAAAALSMAAAASAGQSSRLSFQEVTGAEGVPLNVVEAGDRSNPGILFIHGIRQSYLSFQAQFDSDLIQHFHLVALDLRGHGNSGKPVSPDSYKNNRLWADDIAKVMEATGLHHAVIVGWSYGTLVAADYLRYYGTTELAGVVLAGAWGGLEPPPPPIKDPKAAQGMQRVQQSQGSLDIEEYIAGSKIMVGLLTAKPMPQEWQERTLLVNMMVPPYVRRSLWLQNLNNQDLVAKIGVPVLLIAGSEDGGAPQDQGKDLAAKLAHGRFSYYIGAGHSTFAEEPARFNRELTEFIHGLAH